jgi:hypothetical protein
MHRREFVAGLSGLAVFGLAAPAAAVELRSIRVVDEARLPRIKPDWPVPQDRNQIFYLQRSVNRNTVVYAANFDGAGNLDAQRPVQVYWRRFQDNSAAKPLKRIEHVAFGVTTSRGGQAGDFNVSLRRLPQIPMLLRQTGAGKAELWARIGGKSVQPVYAHAEIDKSGLVDRVTGFSIFGRNPANGRFVGETFSVRGGTVQP